MTKRKSWTETDSCSWKGRYAIQKYNGFLDQKREGHMFRTTLVLYR